MTSRSLAVVDASVALKWALDDEDIVEQAVRLRDDAIDGRFSLVAPSLWVYELANGLVSAVRRGRLSGAQGRRSLGHLMGLGVDLVDPDTNATYAAALRYELSAYDAAYVALAVALGAPLWTGDRGLHRTAARVAVLRWIGDYPG
jgi:predicted nucleic acid-binding protein